MQRKGRPPRKTLSIRVEPDQLEKLAAIIEELEKDFPSVRVSTSDAARFALQVGIGELERRRREARAGRKKP